MTNESEIKGMEKAMLKIAEILRKRDEFAERNNGNISQYQAGFRGGLNAAVEAIEIMIFKAEEENKREARA